MATPSEIMGRYRAGRPARRGRHVHGLPGDRHRCSSARWPSSCWPSTWPRTRTSSRASAARRWPRRACSIRTSCRCSTPARTPTRTATSSSWSTWTGPRARTCCASRSSSTSSETVAIVRDACHGLDYAHRAGVVHRDVKPGNLLMVEETGATKLADFGIAKAAEQTRITQVGAVLGTAAYLSPEQAQGDEAGPPSDIYSLGVCAYQFLTGQAAARVLVAHRARAEAAGASQVEPVSIHRPDVPPELDRAIRRLPRARARRPLPLDARDGAQALDAGLQGDDTEATPLAAGGADARQEATRALTPGDLRTPGDAHPRRRGARAPSRPPRRAARRPGRSRERRASASALARKRRRRRAFLAVLAALMAAVAITLALLASSDGGGTAASTPSTATTCSSRSTASSSSSASTQALSATSAAYARRHRGARSGRRPSSPSRRRRRRRRGRCRSACSMALRRAARRSWRASAGLLLGLAPARAWRGRHRSSASASCASARAERIPASSRCSWPRSRSALVAAASACRRS